MLRLFRGHDTLLASPEVARRVSLAHASQGLHHQGHVQCEKESLVLGWGSLSAVTVGGMMGVSGESVVDQEPGKTELLGLSCNYFIGALALATHCHLPSAIFTHVSANRSLPSNVFPVPSVPLPVHTPVTTAEFPWT
jgi:hypothetical protein